MKRVIPYCVKVSSCQPSFTRQFTGLLIEGFDVCYLAVLLGSVASSTEEANDTRFPKLLENTFYV